MKMHTPVETPEGYERCPDCHGEKYVSRLIQEGDGWSRVRTTSIEPCNRCGFTGIIPREKEHAEKRTK